MTEEEFNMKVVGLHRQMYAHAFVILHDRDEASDCVQESYVKLWEARARLAEVENVSAYCITTVRRFAIDRLRDARKLAPADASEQTDFPSAEASPLGRLQQRDDLSVAKELLMELPPRQRRLVEMSGIAGLSNQEISAATGLSDENVRTLLSRGRSRLRMLFKKTK